MSKPQTPASQLIISKKGRVAIATMSTPAARNAVTREIFEVGLEAFRSFRRDASVGAIVLCGEGGTFCGGGNVKRMLEQRSRPKHTQGEHVDLAHAWIMAMRECPQPIIAAVEGAAVGGGFALALACDLVVAAENATLAMSHAKVGLSPDCGGTFWLARALPHQSALQIMFDASPIPVARLHQLGVVNKVTAPGAAVAEALSWATTLADGPGAAYGRIKRLAYEAEQRGLRDQLDAERDAMVEAMYGDECAEGANAFLQKRAPRFTASD